MRSVLWLAEHLATTMIEPLLLTTARVTTFDGERALTGASGFFFERDERLYFITSRHVLRDPDIGHFPTRIQVDVLTADEDSTSVTVLSVRLYDDAGVAVWHQAGDRGGDIDVAAIGIDRTALAHGASLHCFSPAHLQTSLDEVEVGASLLVVGFPLGFHDTLHHLPVVRHAVVASSFGLRFQGQGIFLTDARTHRGTSGAPVVMRDAAATGALPWKLLGIHSSRLDMKTRDMGLDESLGLNSAWYADVLLALTTADAAQGH